MNNEHNPISRRINYLQDFWVQERLLKPKARFIRWLIDEVDLPLVNGFYQIESSPYGSIEETLVVMLTDFDKLDSFSYQLAKDWLAAFKQDAEKHPELHWEPFTQFENEFKKLPKNDPFLTDNFLVAMLTAFKDFKGVSSNLYIGINPIKISNSQKLCVWICRLLKMLPDTIGFVITDFKKDLFFEPIFENNEADFIKQSIRLNNVNTSGAYTKMMTKGNPNSPQVAFRSCMVEMGKATKAENKEKLIKWGEKGLGIAKKSRDIPFWAYTHLVYAGFLFGFKDPDRFHHIIDKGISLCENDPKDKNIQGLTLQLYGYKAAFYSFTKKKELAKNWFIKQAQLAKEYEQGLVALTSYKNALIVLQQKKQGYQIEELAPEAYEFCITLEDEIIKTTEFPYIAKHYIDVLRRHRKSKEDNQKIEDVDQYLISLFGRDWELMGKELIKKINTNEEKNTTLVN